MIYAITDWLADLGGIYSPLRALNYVTSRSIAAAITTLFFMIFFAPPIIRMLYRAGQRDQHRDFDEHLAKSKRGTPTMGGVIIILAMIVSLGLWGDWTNGYLWMVTSALLVFGALGASDDIAKVRGGGAESGLGRRTKLLMQTLYGLGLGSVLLLPATTPFPLEIADTIGIPFIKPAVHGGVDIHLAWAYIPFVAFVVVAVSNAVNLIDGLDGLAAGTTLLPVAVYALFAYVLGHINLSAYFLYNFQPGVHELVVFSAALIGALIGFLWFNGYPAQVFMGDTGSLALGGVLAVLILLTKQEFLFLIAGGVFIYVNLTHVIGDRIGIHLLGRRLFYRTPIHHAYEHLGIAETKVVLRFWIISLMLALLAVATLKLR